MLVLAMLNFLVVGGVAFLVVSRLEETEREVALLGRGSPETPWVVALRALFAEARIDLSPTARRGGLASHAVTLRETQDPYTDAAQLLAYVLEPARQDLSLMERRIKGVYQLQATFHLADTGIHRCLNAALMELQAASDAPSELALIEPVAAGTLLDRATMWPLNAGSRVRQPLGAIVRGRDGRVLSRAKVWC